MKTPIIKYNDSFLNSVSWNFKVGGITIWPLVILREKYRDKSRWRLAAPRIINHESIHVKQQEEMLILPFYIWYFTEWFIKLFFYGKRSYYNISFEREAHDNETDLDYLSRRKHYAWIKRIFK